MTPEETIAQLDAEEIERCELALAPWTHRPEVQALYFKRRGDEEQMRFAVPVEWTPRQALRAVGLYELGREHGRVDGVAEIREEFRRLMQLAKIE